jgi:hypothetical protein
MIMATYFLATPVLQQKISQVAPCLAATPVVIIIKPPN